ncbi:SID1 transmembrane family member 1-like isoform X2 [Temnothorax curvispinosus]|uniref:SID1 transmembrane family member 1-like isoform X2 n=2 Tax=Temnothorax TaxID=300110 RepID=A0A6J1QJF4_9HYME|nr:SID1 transmembrane family member 1-like isoform X2 [Temnothorax curvispinosus]TGZ57665.1 SID1 transmembrane family member 1 [Temnothorax longispinosus]
MEMQYTLRLITLLLLLHTVRAVTLSSTSPSFSPIVIQADYGINYTKTINATIEYVFLYPTSNISLETARIKIESNATHSLPLIIVVRQTTGILSWQIPLLVNGVNLDTVTYNKTSRTLCSTKYYRYAQNDEEYVIVGISTASRDNIFFQISVVEITDFYLNSGTEVEVQISPSEPIYYGYIFSKQENSSVIVRVESDNDVCMTVSIQNTSCPVFDLERNIEFSGHWQTMSRRGGITVPREAYPLGFFVVLVVKGEDTDCNGLSSSNPLRTKNVTLIVNPTITKRDYVVASASAAAIVLGFCISYIMAVIVFNIRETKKLATQEPINEQSQDVNEHVPSPSTNSPKKWDSVEEDSSLDEDDIDLMEDALSDKDVIRTKVILSVCDLARKEPRILRHKSRLYLYYLATVAIFYTLPVVQLAVTYQRVLHTTGNQDMCYYNFLCAHPLGLLSDFNHVFSNFGYVMLGLLFIFLTSSREHHEPDQEKTKCYGIPQHYGLFYAMGTALIMEGILSASYHVCPSRSNFQFDTSFMYVIAVLCMIKIYQNRHPDINARAPVTFGMLAVIIFAGLIGVLNGSKTFLIIFSILHLLICFFLTVQIYYMGRCKFNRSVFKRVIQRFKHEARCGIWHLLRPLYPARFIMLVLANLCNVGLAVFGNMYQQGNFATFLLAILMSNLILYTFFYIMMKLCHRERILPTPAIYIFLSMLFWGAALYFFVNKTISWALTPAQSRLYNKPCALWNFFDSHDIWHFLSALAMFFSFMVLLTLDDDLTDVHRSQIPVF